jgi:hypothetical protein
MGVRGSYLTLQAIARKMAGYPFTLLEVHTLAHVLCALIMYLLFRQKPADVHGPTLIKLDGEKLDAARQRLQTEEWLLSKRAYNLDTTTIPELESNLAPIVISIMRPLILCTAYGATHIAA